MFESPIVLALTPRAAPLGFAAYRRIRLGVRLKRLGLHDTFRMAPPSLSHEEVWARRRALVAAISNLIGKRLVITEDELTEVRIDHVHSAQKAEAL